MFKFNESAVINRINIVKEGDRAGLLEINASTSPLSSETIYASISDCHAVFSMSNDDQGEQDIDNNVIQVTTHRDSSGK